MVKIRVAGIAALLVCLLPGCGDMGIDPPAAKAPVIASVLPDTGTAGDTVRISGSGFGAARSTGIVRFGGIVAGAYVAWSDTLIDVIVPGGATTGVVTVTADGGTSGGKAFVVPGSASVVRSFSNDVLQLFNRFGCTGCHGGNGGLVVGTRAQLLSGGDHGPAVVPGNSGGSLLVQKLSLNPPFGSRMPLGGPYLPDSSVRVIAEWIDQGALDN